MVNEESGEHQGWDPRIWDLRALMRGWDDPLCDGDEWLRLVKVTRFSDYILSTLEAGHEDRENPSWVTQDLSGLFSLLECYPKPRHALFPLVLWSPERISWNAQGRLHVGEQVLPQELLPGELRPASKGARELEAKERARGLLPKAASQVALGQEKVEILKCRCLLSGFVCNRCVILAKRPGSWRGKHPSIWSVFGDWFGEGYSLATRLLFRELEEASSLFVMGRKCREAKKIRPERRGKPSPVFLM